MGVVQRDYMLWTAWRKNCEQDGQRAKSYEFARMPLSQSDGVKIRHGCMPCCMSACRTAS